MAARTGVHGRGVARWVVLALLLQVALTIVDVVSADEVVFTTTFVLAPFALAVAGNPRATALVGAVSVVLAIVSGFWNGYGGSSDHLLRITIVTAGALLATLASWALERAAEQRARMSVLAAVGHLSGAEHVEAAVAGLAEALVPAAADSCWVDLHADGELTRLFAHGEDPKPPPPQPINAAQLQAHQTRALVPLQDGLGILGLATNKGRYTPDDLGFFEILAGR